MKRNICTETTLHSGVEGTIRTAWRDVEGTEQLAGRDMTMVLGAATGMTEVQGIDSGAAEEGMFPDRSSKMGFYYFS